MVLMSVEPVGCKTSYEAGVLAMVGSVRMRTRERDGPDWDLVAIGAYRRKCQVLRLLHSDMARGTTVKEWGWSAG